MSSNTAGSSTRTPIRPVISKSAAGRAARALPAGTSAASFAPRAAPEWRRDPEMLVVAHLSPWFEDSGRARHSRRTPASRFPDRVLARAPRSPALPQRYPQKRQRNGTRPVNIEIMGPCAVLPCSMTSRHQRFSSEVAIWLGTISRIRPICAFRSAFTIRSNPSRPRWPGRSR